MGCRLLLHRGAERRKERRERALLVWIPPRAVTSGHEKERSSSKRGLFASTVLQTDVPSYSRSVRQTRGVCNQPSLVVALLPSIYLSLRRTEPVPSLSIWVVVGISWPPLALCVPLRRVQQGWYLWSWKKWWLCSCSSPSFSRFRKNEHRGLHFCTSCFCFC